MTDTLRLFGHDFRPMTDDDFDGLAGAEPGSFIAELSDALLIWSPADQSLTEIPMEGPERSWSISERMMGSDR